MVKKNIKKTKVKRKIIKAKTFKTKSLHNNDYDSHAFSCYDDDDDYLEFRNIPTWEFILYTVLFIMFLPLILLAVIILFMYINVIDWFDKKEDYNQSNKRR